MSNKNLKNNNFSHIGLNFSRAKYRIIRKNSFIPHIRSNLQASIPYRILSNFTFDRNKHPIALVNIISPHSKCIRIKKLMKTANSLDISLKAEKGLNEIKIDIINIKNGIDLQKRTNVPKTGAIPVYSIIPEFTLDYSPPYQNGKKIAPIYLFEQNSKIIAGSYLSRKDVIFERRIELDSLTCASIGLYYSEGGKTRASFTNSHPLMINLILEFLEKVSNIKRNKLAASINCNGKSITKKRNLEEFWSSQTGIEKFHNKLHISKNVKSPCGILEVYFDSKLIKEFMCSMFNLIFQRSNLDYMNIIRGILSGDGSPILQTKTYITHHIATDKRCITFQEKFINKLFKHKISTIRKINDGKIVLYNNWATNLNFLLLDPYKFNMHNRLKFAEQFLNLEATKIFTNIKDNDVIKGIDMAKHNMKPILLFKNLGYVELHQISPKPNKKYEIMLTNKGKEKQKRIKNFIENIYPAYKKDVENFNKTLRKFNL